MFAVLNQAVNNNTGFERNSDTLHAVIFGDTDLLYSKNGQATISYTDFHVKTLISIFVLFGLFSAKIA